MNAPIVFGLFALYVAMTSLYLVLSGRQDAVLTFLRRCWGRTLGHSLYFVARVALPLLICVVCLGWGVRHYDAETLSHFKPPSMQLNVDGYRDLLQAWQKEHRAEVMEVVYGA